MISYVDGLSKVKNNLRQNYSKHGIYNESEGVYVCVEFENI